jgi:hypothetical protein
VLAAAAAAAQEIMNVAIENGSVWEMIKSRNRADK